jgi:hypothetical protein
VKELALELETTAESSLRDQPFLHTQAHLYHVVAGDRARVTGRIQLMVDGRGGVQ